MRKVLLFLSGLLFVAGVAEALPRESIVKSFQIQGETKRSRIVFDLSAKATRNIFLLEHPDRVVIDLQHARLATRIAKPRRSDPTIRAIRAAPRNEHDLRIVLDLKRKVETKSRLKRSRDGHQLVLDLYPSEKLKETRKADSQKIARTPKKSRSSKEPNTTARSDKKESAPKTEERPPEISSVKAPEAVTDSSQALPNTLTARASDQSDEFVVAIDAGHGGNDPGARGVNGTWEKDVVLNIAKKLNRLITRESGMRAVMIRDGDYFLALRKRMRLARAANADVFISIHADAYQQSDIRGSSVYTLSQQGASSEAARWLAARENESDRLGGVRLDDKDDMLAEVLLDLSQTATLDASADLANHVLGKLGRLGKVHKRTVQSAGFAVLKAPDIPSILVETAFISNPNEEKNLANSSYQTKLAKAILEGIRSYHRDRAIPQRNLASRTHVIESGETLSGIARRYGLSTQQLQAANTMKTTTIKAGQVLEIPSGS